MTGTSTIVELTDIQASTKMPLTTVELDNTKAPTDQNGTFNISIVTSLSPLLS